MDLVSVVGIAFILCAFCYAFLRKAPLSLTTATAFLAVYALLAVTSRDWGNPALSPGFRDMVLNHRGSWRADELPAFFTAIFVHHDLLHLGFNTAALILIGMPLEERIGTPAFAVTFILGGIFGALTFYALHFSDFFALLGASAAISAELGAFARLYPRERMMLFLPIFPMPSVPVIWVAIGFLVISTAFVYMLPPGSVAHEAHIGGLITGFLIAPLVVKLPSKRKVTIKALDLAALEKLAKTLELSEMLAKTKGESVPEVRNAWLEMFVKRARCPECDGPLRIRWGRIVSDCGWKLRYQ